jgi:hypothetical protein
MTHIWGKSPKSTKKGAKNIWVGLFHAAGEKSVKKVEKYHFEHQKT